jgi:hypothetical protein
LRKKLWKYQRYQTFYDYKSAKIYILFYFVKIISLKKLKPYQWCPL